MSANRNGPMLNLAGVVLAAGLTLSTGVGFAFAAEQPSAEQIIKALKPRPLTRSLTTTPPTRLVAPRKCASWTACATGRPAR